ncbi:hypothetical protein NB640_07005 [Oxalobacter vibrioformis]|uniref:Uncharacterized protein n=1 Tax=Oxalobacter vibrioformis TaxID=933080 RepID=A0A9E9LWZ1_9BURK|nr:PP0621 family protein [Oxalobacter vibrioformis]NLC24958.1 hypothetical protein [Oxalobacter sp.]WAW09037.1 hypothetical protein NB640_07005 [Oxalobacter vibrioformis]
MTWLMWLLVFVLVIAAIVAKIKRSARIVIFRNEDGRFRADKFGNDENDQRQVHGLRSSNVEQMLACARCGVYVPASEAVFRTGKVYCCEEHSVQP